MLSINELWETKRVFFYVNEFQNLTLVYCFYFQNEVLDVLQTRAPRVLIRCDYTLMSLKHERSTRDCYDECVERYTSARHMSLFVSACYKALYAHDWDRLLYILRRVPKWKIRHMQTFHVRVSTIVYLYLSDFIYQLLPVIHYECIKNYFK